MYVNLTLKNYRCFPASRPARIEIRDGFRALIGANNSGKSALLKCLYEFRPLFETLAGNANWVANGIAGGDVATGINGISDQAEIYTDTNNLNLVISIEIDPDRESEPRLVSFRCKTRVVSRV